MAIKLDDIMQSLRTVRDPNIGKDVMSLGMIRDLKIEGDEVRLKLVLKNAADPAYAALEQSVKDALARAGAMKITVTVESLTPKTSSATSGADKHGVPGVRNIIAVSSGKGGVGKSTVAANLAISLAKNGASVGLLDCDIYGPNIPTMMGVEEPPHAINDEKRGELIIPLDAHGVKVMSMGLLTKGDQPVIWRGPMLHSVVSQFLLKVEWGNLDYLVVDMPPGTGDVQLSLTQLVPVTGAVIVTTPQEVSAQDVRKAILMFEKVGVPVIGLVENMSYFVPADMPSKKYHIFGQGAGRMISEKFQVPLLAQLPIDPNVCEGGDMGAPITITNPNSEVSRVFTDLARAVSHKINETKTRTTEIGAF